VLGALSTGHEIGLAVVGGVFIAFALAASFLAPRRWPEFPGRNGMSVFIIASLALFAAMIAAVAIFGAESKEAEAARPGGQETAAPAAKTIDITETEFRIGLPTLSKLAEGTYTFVVKNAGKIEHDLVISGGKATGETRTPLLKPGETAKITASLAAGRYTLYCSVPGHRAAGMQAVLTVG
jgi:uncharacterized cupredoxin-like copper-binding protein